MGFTPEAGAPQGRAGGCCGHVWCLFMELQPEAELITASDTGMDTVQVNAGLAPLIPAHPSAPHYDLSISAQNNTITPWKMFPH